jgi:hypothetical protein
VSPVCSCERWIQGIAIRAKQPQVFFSIVPPVPVNMICYQRNDPRVYIYFCPAAKAALIAELIPEISLHDRRDETHLVQPLYFFCLPSLNIETALITCLAFVAAILIAGARRFFTA